MSVYWDFDIDETPSVSEHQAPIDVFGKVNNSPLSNENFYGSDIKGLNLHRSVPGVTIGCKTAPEKCHRIETKELSDYYWFSPSWNYDEVVVVPGESSNSFRLGQLIPKQTIDSGTYFSGDGFVMTMKDGGSNYNDFRDDEFFQVAVTPEPSSMILLGLGLVAGLIRKKKKVVTI